MVCSKDWAEFFLFLADLAKFTKNARNTVECYLKAKHRFFIFHFKVSLAFVQIAYYQDITVSRLL